MVPRTDVERKASRARALHRLFACLTVWGLLLAVSPAAAELSGADKAAAQALFDRGLVLLREGKLAEACSRLEQSQDIERAIGTMLYLAECYERSGKTASAWALFREASSLAAAAGQQQRAETGQMRAERLEGRLATLTIAITGVPAGLTLLRNGSPLSESLWGVPLPVDPGEQLVEARAPGYLPWSETVLVGESAAETVTVPELTELAPTASRDAAPPGNPSRARDSQAQPAPGYKDRTRWSKTRSAGAAIGGVGLVLLGVGGGYGIKAIVDNNASEERCKDGSERCASRRGVRLAREANESARLSNALLISGAVALTGGLLTYLLAPERERPRVHVSAGDKQASLLVRGVF